MYRTDFGTQWEKVRVGCSERIALKQVYYQGWNRSPAQVGYMRQVFRDGALGRPRGIGWGGRREGRSGWGTHVNPWLIHVNVWQKPLQYCRVISPRLMKINEKKKRSDILWKPMSMKQTVCKSSNKSVDSGFGGKKGRPIPSICLYPHLNEWMAIPGWNVINIVKLTKES